MGGGREGVEYITHVRMEYMFYATNEICFKAKMIFIALYY